MRPSRPEPAIAVGSKSCSSTSLRTAGPILLADADERPAAGAAAAASCGAGAGSAAAFGGGVVLAAGALSLAAGAAAAATAPGSKIASSWPLVTTAPSLATISRMTPSTGEGTSSTTLSVSRSSRFSSRRTESPAFLCQAAMVASDTDSGRTGTLTSMLMDEVLVAWKGGGCGSFGGVVDRRIDQRILDQLRLLDHVRRQVA